jgi:peptidoglycan/LPS O-acetylase OafA/YrhL
MGDKRFYSLDAMRGIAALVVVMLHVGEVMHLRSFPYAYLAVDFFFMLSGFVLTRAYEPKLKSAMSAGRFVETRLIRLYPMFGLGIFLGAIQIGGQIALHSPHAPSASHAALGLAMNALVLPDMTSATTLFTFDGPGWTLFLELVINTLFAVALFKMRSPVLALIGAVAAALYMWGIFPGGYGDIGWNWQTIGFGLLRVSFAFPLGVLTARAYGSTVKRRTPFALLPIGAMTLLLAIDVPVRFAWSYGLVTSFLLMPAILWSGAVLSLPKRLEKIGAALGDASYPLFAIHYPLLRIFFWLFVEKLHLPPAPMAAIFVPACVWLSWFLFHQLDVPVRHWLKARTRPVPAIMPVTP